MEHELSAVSSFRLSWQAIMNSLAYSACNRTTSSHKSCLCLFLSVARPPRDIRGAGVTYGAPPGPPSFKHRQRYDGGHPVNGGAPRLMSAAAAGAVGAAQPESRSEGEIDHGARTLPSFGKPEDRADASELRLKSMKLSHLINKRSRPTFAVMGACSPSGRTYRHNSGDRLPSV